MRLDFASEFKYFPPPVQGLVIGILNPGKLPIPYLHLNRLKYLTNRTTLAITNVLGSSISRNTDFTLFMRAGPEISVAATKSFIAQSRSLVASDKFNS